MSRETSCSISIRATLYIYKGSTRVAGPGLIEALRAVAETGSIRAAARKLGINYRRLWARIQAAERLLGVKLLVKKQKGSYLTREAEEILKIYTEMQEKAQSLGLLAKEVITCNNHTKQKYTTSTHSP